MEQIENFFQQHGLVLTIIAVVGIILLGILKYCNVFSKVEEKYRHLIYLAISVGVSIIASIVYLAIVKQLSVGYVFGIAGSIFALNQAMYAIYANTPLKELLNKVINFIKNKITGNKENNTEETTTEEKNVTNSDEDTTDSENTQDKQ